MLIFAFYEKCLPISSTKDSTTAQGVKINWFEKFEMLRLLSLTKSILLCTDLTREQWFFNLPKPMFAKLCFCFEISGFCTICKWLISKLTFLGKGNHCKIFVFLLWYFLTLYSHKHHLHAKYRYGGPSNVIYLCSIRCKGHHSKMTLQNTRLSCRVSQYELL